MSALHDLHEDRTIISHIISPLKTKYQHRLESRRDDDALILTCQDVNVKFSYFAQRMSSL